MQRLQYMTTQTHPYRQPSAFATVTEIFSLRPGTKPIDLSLAPRRHPLSHMGVSPFAVLLLSAAPLSSDIQLDTTSLYVFRRKSQLDVNIDLTAKIRQYAKNRRFSPIYRPHSAPACCRRLFIPTFAKKPVQRTGFLISYTILAFFIAASTGFAATAISTEETALAARRIHSTPKTIA